MLAYSMVFIGCFYKSNYSSPDLHGITLKIHEVEMNVEGTRIKELVIYSLYVKDFI